MLDGLRSGLAKAQYSMVVHSNNYSLEEELAWVQRLMSWRPAGIVLTGVTHDKRVSKIIQNAGIPTAEIWDVSEDPIDFCVGVDHWDAGRSLARYAISKGYKRPGFVIGNVGHDPRADKRFLGACSAFCEAFECFEPAIETSLEQNQFKWGYSATLLLCQRNPRPDVILYVNDHLAIGGLSACEKVGISSPLDIGLIGFNDLDIASVMTRKLTTSRTPRHQIGLVAAQHLLARLNNVRVERSTRLRTKLLEGETTRQQ